MFGRALLIGVAVVCAIVALMWLRAWSGRRRCVRALQARQDADLDVEFSWVIAKAPGETSRPDVERLWTTLARGYQLPWRKLRAGDRLRGELTGVVSYPDADMFAWPLCLGASKTARAQFGAAEDWADLVIAIRRLEIETGRQCDAS